MAEIHYWVVEVNNLDNLWEYRKFNFCTIHEVVLTQCSERQEYVALCIEHSHATSSYWPTHMSTLKYENRVIAKENIKVKSFLCKYEKVYYGKDNHQFWAWQIKHWLFADSDVVDAPAGKKSPHVLF